MSKNFIAKKNVRVLKKINLKLKLGKIYSLMGPSGSGKSTLLNIISFLDSADSGEIFLNGTNLKKLNEIDKNELRKNKISVIFQNNNLLNDFTAIENILMPLILEI